MLTDSNDSPPVCESSVYRASLDEGAGFFDPPLFIKVRDADSISDISFRLDNANFIRIFLIRLIPIIFLHEILISFFNCDFTETELWIMMKY